MANYKINTDKKTVIVSDKLTEAEQSILGLYIAQGYIIIPKASANRITLEAIKASVSEDIFNEFISVKDNDTYIDKNGKERKKGYLKALQWLRENHKDEYNKIRLKLNKK